METIRIPLKKGEKLRLSKPEDVSLIVRDNRREKGFFKVKTKNGSILNDDEIVSLARKQRELEAEKRQLKGLTRAELSAVLHAVEKYDKRKTQYKQKIQLEKESSKERIRQHIKEFVSKPYVPKPITESKTVVIQTVDFDRLKKLPRNKLFNELRKEHPSIIDKEEIVLRPLLFGDDKPSFKIYNDEVV